MKNLIYILVLLSQAAWAQTSFEQANALYQKGSYNAAADAYEAILSGKKESPELYFNLGNAYYKLNRVAPAIYNYEMALLLRPGYKDAVVNLGYARKMTIDHISDSGPTQPALYRLVSFFGYDTWAWIGVVSAFLFAGAFAGYYLSASAQKKRRFFGAMAAMAFVLLLSISTAYYVRSVQAGSHPAIVFATSVPLRGEPNARAAAAFTLHEGTKVEVLEKLDNWKKVRLPNNTEGWIPAGAVRELKR